jgi:hypothetical protein
MLLGSSNLRSDQPEGLNNIPSLVVFWIDASATA